MTEKKKNIFDYVESRMTFIAPNLSIIVGASTAAKLMGKLLVFHTVEIKSVLTILNKSSLLNKIR